MTKPERMGLGSTDFKRGASELKLPNSAQEQAENILTLLQRKTPITLALNDAGEFDTSSVFTIPNQKTHPANVTLTQDVLEILYRDHGNALKSINGFWPVQISIMPLLKTDSDDAKTSFMDACRTQIRANNAAPSFGKKRGGPGGP